MAQDARTVTMKGKLLTLSGRAVSAGDDAPDFVAVGNDLAEVRLADFAGKRLVLSSVPSLDTSVCSLETKTFNEKAADAGDDVVICTISMDLPFAQKRWCGAEGIERVVTVSDHRDAAFGQAYGVLLGDLRLLARAVFVVDCAGRIRYVQIVDEITKEPDYDAVMESLAELGRA